MENETAATPIEEVPTTHVTEEVEQEAANAEPMVLTEVVDTEVQGTYIGQTKWFNDKLGFGFITICSGDEKGKDIFVHHSGIKPSNSNYKTLRKGEYIQFNVIQGLNGLQAVDVRGIGGGPLMCDFVSTRRTNTPVPPPKLSPKPVGTWQTVNKKAAKYQKKSYADAPTSAEQ